MSDTKFTPGPWSTRQIVMNADVEISAQTPQGHLSVCWVHIGQGADLSDIKSALADARLIAAAPDGYALAEEIVNHLYLKHDIARVRQMAKDFIAKVQR